MLSDNINEIRNNLRNYPPRLTPIGLVAIAFIFLILILIHNNRIKNYKFKGIVEDVTYNQNRYPVVKINGEEYTLDYDGWGLNENKIYTGDELIKNKGEMELKLIKPDKKDTINLLFKEK